MHAIGFSLWVILLAAILAIPLAVPNAPLKWWHVHLTIDLALFLYFIVIVGMLTRRDRYEAELRACWSLAWLTYVVHVLLAFHHVHGWSHDHAIEHTRRISGVGEGIFVSHFFTLVWGVDVMWWRIAPQRYRVRPRVLSAAIHGFMAFIILNGTVIFETGPIRYAGIVGTLIILMLLFRTWKKRSERVQP